VREERTVAGQHKEKKKDEVWIGKGKKKKPGR